MAEIANGGDTALQVFASHLCAQERALNGPFREGQKKPGCKNAVFVALGLGFWRNNDVEKLVGVASIKPGSNVALLRSIMFVPAGTLIAADAPVHCLALFLASSLSSGSHRPITIKSKPSSFHPSTPPIIFFTFRPSRARLAAPRSAPLQCGPPQ